MNIFYSLFSFTQKVDKSDKHVKTNIFNFLLTKIKNQAL